MRFSNFQLSTSDEFLKTNRWNDRFQIATGLTAYRFKVFLYCSKSCLFCIVGSKSANPSCRHAIKARVAANSSQLLCNDIITAYISTTCLSIPSSQPWQKSKCWYCLCRGRSNWCSRCTSMLLVLFDEWNFKSHKTAYVPIHHLLLNPPAQSSRSFGLSCFCAWLGLSQESALAFGFFFR